MRDKLVALKDRLNDLSRRNRSIRMLKCYDKWSFDMSLIRKIGGNPEQILNQFIDKNNRETLLKQEMNNEESLVLSRKLTTLYRNINAIEEETGLYDLFVGYPFISGAMLDGTYVRAPLFLYPARLIREKTHGVIWKIEPNDEMEPQLNRTLFLAMKKMSDLNVPDEIYDEAEDQVYHRDLESWSSWLKGYGLNTSLTDQETIITFQDYKKETIPTFQKGQFQLENMAVLGHFPQGDSALLKDYEDFILQIETDQDDFGMIEDLLEAGDLDRDKEDLVDNLDTAEQGSSQDHNKTSEKERFYVLDTDSSQEEILESLDDTMGLVVHGPPGTGKSQVIVNMIANAMAGHKKVLLVCQKRAALDVVYQRLDSLGLSSNIGLLHDEKNDRKSLYRKLNNRLTREIEQYEEIEEEFEHFSQKIEKTEHQLDQIARGLYEVQPFGYRAFDLYGLGKPMSEQDDILDLSQVLPELNKNNLEDVLTTIFSYGSYYKRFGQEDYPLKDRKSFAKLEIKDRLTIVEILKKAIEKAEQSTDYLEHFDQEDMTPEYSWNINDKLEKIYEDLDANEKKTLQRLRLWWWTSFTGKTIIEELLQGQPFKGVSSKEWPKLRESLIILYKLSQVSEGMTSDLEQLKAYFSKDKIEHLHRKITKGDIPLKELMKQQEFVIQDFEALRNMDRTYDESLPFIQKLIEELKTKTKGNATKDLEELWVNIARQSAYIYWIDDIERKHPDLLKIGTEQFNKLRTSFKELLDEKKELSVKVLQNRLAHTMLAIKQNETKAIKEIEYQTGKKRRVWPVRRLVREYSLHGLLDVIPVWLVSPETASAIFPLEKDLFDLVIFDEASQCTVENGLPAIYRGSKIIVAGDEKQLPPSNMFRGSLQSDEDDEDLAEFEESESLLNLAKRVFPSKMLQWHYRSKSEELINFSNHAYYNGNIQIAPNVRHLQQPAALQWLKVDGRWINQCNEVEADAVVDLLKQLLVKDGNKSIGIITFNAKQQDKIQDMIDSKVEEDEEFSAIYNQVMSRDLDERVFVKNIENVQGDERDIIIFSIAYAKNEEGRVYNRFGSLGQQGGENRLNVAITRAKEAIYVVSSIEPYELNVSNTKNDGPKFLKGYMEYAEAVSQLEKEKIEAVLKELNEDMNTARSDDHKSLDFDSPFEAQVHERLTAIGYQVDTQVGMSGYRIDQAIVHPHHSDQYILGIECDGAMYHSAPSAKERDVYRQRFLESKGWRISRIWSRNWWKDPTAEIEKIDQQIKEIIRMEETKEKVIENSLSHSKPSQ